MEKRLRVQIFPDGHVQAETQGVKGKKCIEYIRILEEILEAETVDSEYTAEYYVAEGTTVDTTQEQSLQQEDS